MNATAGPVIVTIQVNGEAIPLTYNILGVVVTKEVNKISSARILISDGDPAQQDFPISDTDTFIPGQSIEILAGYEGQTSSIFQGIVIQQGIQVHPRQPSHLVVECRDAAVKMTVGRKNACFAQMTDSAVIEQIFSGYELSPEVSPTTVVHPELIQYYVSDWDFVVSRAEVNSQLVFLNDGTVSVSVPTINPTPAVTLTYGMDMLDFSAQLDARYQFSAVQSSSWDVALQQVARAEGSPPTLPQQGNLSTDQLAETIGLKFLGLQHTGDLATPELEVWASAELLRSQLAKIRGTVRMQGIADIKPGDTIGLAGVGDRFNGNAFVSGVRQEIEQGNWFTVIQFGLSPQWFTTTYDDIMASPAAGLIPGLWGLQIGIVSQLAGDPDGEFRVQVRIPILGPAQPGIWARLNTLDAGKGYGSFFLPNIGQEVVLAFVNDDPRDPIILGMLNSSANPAPFIATDENAQKGFVTQSKIQLVFNDDEQSVLIQTPQKNTISLNDQTGTIEIEDSHQNKITLTAEGITVDSAQALTLKAQTDLNITGNNISLTAQGNFDLQGANISQQASAQFQAQGGAGTELTSSAETTIKGSMVRIN